MPLRARLYHEILSLGAMCPILVPTEPASFAVPQGPPSIALGWQGCRRSQGALHLRLCVSALPSWISQLGSPDCTKTSRDLLYIFGRSSHINFVWSTAGIIAAYINFFLGYMSRDPVPTGRH